ncbi:MAG: DUF1223 domain-containing protein [Rhizobiales bacterium]|nr:DUF1223 domain-containing protein [Hyphomicrobiales bacterium]
MFGIHKAALALIVAIITTSPALAGDKVVVELFTSQGCSSCPPADALMGKLAERDELIVLSLPVDYWDFLGWQDTLADPANSQRQRDYARNRGDSHVYTPQVVIGGLDHAVGSSLKQIEDKIAAAREEQEQHSVDIAVAEQGGTIIVNIEGDQPDAAEDATIWLVLYRSAIPVKIGRGENTGNTITYYNVVTEMTPIGMWHGTPARFELPKSELTRGESDGCAVLVQGRDTGPILAAAHVSTW